MPLPWKKTRVGRISKMVADLQSPKIRGRSMVVQTGFPTSLIDLFVKNRVRLRKQSKKNRNSDKRSDFDSVDRVSDPIVSCSEKGSEDFSVSVVPNSGEIESFIAKKNGQDTDSSEVVVVEELGRDLRSVFVAVVKGFAVVVLALCTTKFAVGITIAAFLLLFLECVGKHFACLKKPYLSVRSGLEFMAMRLGYAVLVLRSDVVVKEKSDGVVFELVEPGVESDSSVEEIEVVGGSVCSDEGFSRSYSLCFDGSVSQRSLCEYLVSDDEKSKKIEAGDHTDEASVSVCDKSKSKGRRKFVRKIGVKLIKKFVSKKLSKKHQSGTELDPKPSNEVCDSMAAEGSVEQEGQREEVESENSSMLSENSVNNSEKQEADGMVTSLIVEKKGTESKENFGYLILFLIALVGLVGGRILALMLIITWCFMLKVISSWSRSGFMPFSMKRCSPPIAL